MSLCDIHQALDRIRVAEEDSPIAVFTTHRPGVVDAMFAATVLARELLATRPPNLIGVYHRGHSLKEVAAEIHRRS